MGEVYEGTKFNYIELRKDIPKHPFIDKLKYWCSVFEEQKFAPNNIGGSAGNLSYRLHTGSDRFIITCSGSSLSKTMKDSDFSDVIECNLKLNYIKASGYKEPSSESFLHYLIYKNRPEIYSIFHGHSFEILKRAKEMSLPHTMTEYEYGTTELAIDTSNFLKGKDFIIIKNHGFISLGKTWDEAGKRILYIQNRMKYEI